MISDKNFKLSKRSKTILGLLPMTKTQRNDFRRSMIEAEVAAESARRASLKSKGNKTKDAE